MMGNCFSTKSGGIEEIILLEARYVTISLEVADTLKFFRMAAVNLFR